jgi:hypothetical protein
MDTARLLDQLQMEGRNAHGPQWWTVSQRAIRRAGAVTAGERLIVCLLVDLLLSVTVSPLGEVERTVKGAAEPPNRRP